MDAAGTPVLTDLGSAHATAVDGVWLRPHAPRRLAVGSVLRFGGDDEEYVVASLGAAGRP